MDEQLDLLTSFAAVSPAKTSARPDVALASTAHAPGCGSKCSESCERCGPFGSSLKTALLCELEALTGCSLAWRKTVTPAGRSWLVLTTSERLTSENVPGSSRALWPTATAGDAKASGSRTAAGSAAHPGVSLTDVVVHGLTISDTAGRGPHHPANCNTLGKPSAPSRVLNADWVFQLMGYPREWARLSTARGSRLPAIPSSPISPR